MTTYIINGSLVEVEDDRTVTGITPDDYNNQRYSDEQDVIEPTELGDSLKQLNKADIDPETKMSDIDMRTILHPFQVHSLSALEMCISMGMIPKDCIRLPMQIKRNAVSINGRGREQIVQMVAGKRDQDVQKAGGIKGWAKGLFGMNGGGPQ